MKVNPRYIDGSYLQSNPDWDLSHIPWKLKCIHDLTSRASELKDISFIVEIGCGLGLVIEEVAKSFPNSQCKGFDPSSELPNYWLKHEFPTNLELVNSIYSSDRLCPDYVILFDILEHLEDPFALLQTLAKAKPIVACLLPLEVSMTSLLFPESFRKSYSKVGHIHFYSLETAKILFEESGYDILWIEVTERYRASKEKNPLSFLIREAFRIIFGKKLLSIVLGGTSVLILATPQRS